MSNPTPDTQELNTGLQRLQELSAKDKLEDNELSEIAELRDRLFQRLNTMMITVRHTAYDAILAEEARRRQKKQASTRTSKPEPSLTERPYKPIDPPYMNLRGPVLNYETPKTVDDLQALLKKTFGVGNIPLAFSKAVLKQGMGKAQLENRGEWAVYLTLLSRPGRAMTEDELVEATGYNIGSVAGCLHRLSAQGLVAKPEAKENAYITT